MVRVFGLGTGQGVTGDVWIVFIHHGLSGHSCDPSPLSPYQTLSAGQLLFSSSFCSLSRWLMSS